jgi:hypothetical protein
MNSKDYKEYKKILHNTIVPPNLELIEQAEKYHELTDFIIQKMPKLLFRYRSCSELNFDALDNGIIWTSKAKGMNDDFDARICYDKTKIKQVINSYFNSDNSLKLFTEIKNSIELPKNIMTLPYAKELYQYIKNTSQEKLNQESLNFKNLLDKVLKKNIENLINILQDQLKFACFSENIGSISMWGLYANNGTGFALGYDFTNNNLNNCSVCNLKYNCKYRTLCNILPVNYINTRFDATEYIITLAQNTILTDLANKQGIEINNNLIIPFQDNFMTTKIALHKSIEWQREKEWRMFCDNKQLLNEEHTAIKKFPKAIYLGLNISPINEKILTSIAKEKNISIYKMIISPNNKQYKLTPKIVYKSINKK